MKTRKVQIIAVFSAILALAFAGSLARADEFDEAMKLTFREPVQVPGQVLPAGSYWFVRVGHGAETNVLTVYNVDRTKTITTLNTGTMETVEPTGYVTIKMADRSPKPPSLLGVVYPGRTEGHAFDLMYSDQEKKQLSEFPTITMKVNEKGEMERTEARANH
jgi:hypothetical protein